MAKIREVIPPTPIINRHTGTETQFGPRRAFDGAYVLELLNASGCTAEEAKTVVTVLEPLLENCDGFTIKQFLNLLRIYHPHEWPKPKPRLTIVETNELIDDDKAKGRTS
jgi:hypothetical protein